MNINLENNKKVIVSFDKCGNVYFGVDNDIYDLSIDKDNKLSCDKYVIKDPGIVYVNTDPAIFGKLKISDQPNSLRGKARKQQLLDAEKEKEELNSDEEEHEDIEDPFTEKDLDYFENYDINIDNNEDTDEEYFIFLETGESFNVYEREHTNALYNTILLKNNNICFKSKIIGGLPVYNLRIYDDNNIQFKISVDNDTKWQFYKLVLTDDNSLKLKVAEPTSS